MTEDEGRPDLASRIADFLGAEPPYERKGIRVGPEDLPALVRGYRDFNAKVLKLEHPPYQLRAIEVILQKPLVCVVKGRQIGFSAYILAPAVVYRLFTRPHSLILLVSPTMRQSTLDLQAIRQLVAGNALLRPSMVDVSQERVKLSNGSEVVSLPSGPDGSTIRGYSGVDMALVDEAAYVPDVVVESVLIPMLATSRGSLVLGGTPWGVGSFFHRASQNEAYQALHLPTMVSPFVSREWLEERRLEMDSVAYRTEFEAEFVATADAYFDRTLIDKASRDYDYRSVPREGDRLSYWVGVDWGRRVDASVVAVVERDSSQDPPAFTLAHLKAFDQTPYDVVMGYVANVTRDFGARKILADEGAGLAQLDLMRGQGLPVKGFSFTLASKVDLFSKLKVLLEQGRLMIPRGDRRLLLELTSFRYDISPSGAMRLHGERDDLVDALALAVSAAWTRGRGKPGVAVLDLSFLRARREAREWWSRRPPPPGGSSSTPID